MKKTILSGLLFIVVIITTKAQPYLPIGINATSIDFSTGNLNNLTAAGFYRGYGISNAPDAGWWYVTVESHDNTGGDAPGWTKQTATSYGAGNTFQAGSTFIRNQIGGTYWTPWSMVLQSGYSGNVGIGTLSPAYKLHVNGNGWFEGDLFGANKITAGNGLVAGTGNAEGLRMMHEGAFLCGWNGANTARTGYLQFNAGRDVILSAENGNRLAFYTGGTEKATILNNGNVGIGTSTPGSYKLAIEGIVGARKIKVTQDTWADYVFDSTYLLVSLQEIEKYIQQNKHLPDVPSATEVKERGLDLGDNQVVLLRKIEELTLYIIEQNKQLAEQKKVNQEQIKSNTALETRLDEIERRLASQAK